MSIGCSSEPEEKAPRRKPGRPLDAAKRARVLETAAHYFLHNGYAATAIEQVAAEAGVSKVTIYNQFGDKRALFTAAVDRECEKIRGYFAFEETARGPIRDRLVAIGQAICAFLGRPEMLRFERRIAAETEFDPAIGAAFLDAGPWRMKQDFGAWLAREVEAGELALADPMLAAEQFVAMCKGMGDLERLFGAAVDGADIDRRIEGAADVFLAAYGPAPATRPHR